MSYRINTSNLSEEDRLLHQEIEASTKINQDALMDHWLHGTPMPHVSSSASGGGLSSNETGSLFSIDCRQNDYMFKTAASALGPGGLVTALQNDPTLIEKYSPDELSKMQAASDGASVSQAKPHNMPHISARQWKAIQRYPALVEFLGSAQGDKIASEIANKVNKLMVFALNDNAKKLSKYAYSCESAGNNLKQFYVNKDDNWVCQVTANGPFRGDEAIYYNPDKDKSYVLRLKETEYEDVSGLFNVIHEFAQGEETNAEND